MSNKFNKYSNLNNLDIDKPAVLGYNV